MDSSDYLKVTVVIEPFSEDNAEILEAMLSDLPYDSFEIGEGCVDCYIQKPLFDRQALKAVLSGLSFKTSFTALPVPYMNWNAQWESEFQPMIRHVPDTISVSVPRWPSAQVIMTRHI